jgi:hypothetical protein
LKKYLGIGRNRFLWRASGPAPAPSHKFFIQGRPRRIQPASASGFVAPTMNPLIPTLF